MVRQRQFQNRTSQSCQLKLGSILLSNKLLHLRYFVPAFHLTQRNAGVHHELLLLSQQVVEVDRLGVGHIIDFADHRLAKGNNLRIQLHNQRRQILLIMVAGNEARDDVRNEVRKYLSRDQEYLSFFRSAIGSYRAKRGLRRFYECDSSSSENLELLPYTSG